MNNNNKRSIRIILFGLVVLLGLSARLAFSGMGGGQIPQIPAFLPYSTDVAMSERYPIDGEWVVNTIRKRIRIEAGRAYAIDSWLHLFVLKVEPLMVVIQDIQRTGPGQYSGYDLPLMGAWNATLMPDGTLNVTVQGTLGPVSYKLIPMRQDNPELFAQEKAGQYNQPALTTPPSISTPTPPPATQPVEQPVTPPTQPDLSNCQQLDVDTITGEIICLD